MLRYEVSPRGKKYDAYQNLISGLEACIRPIRKEKERFTRKNQGQYLHLLDAYRRRWISTSPRLIEFDIKLKNYSKKEKENQEIDDKVEDIFTLF